MSEQSIDLSRSHVFRLAELTAHKNPNGSESWNILHGRLPTGEEVALHVSMQPAGTPPNPAHRIDHTEIICLREGALDFMHDGSTEHAAAGDVLFVAKGTMHGVRNVGAEAAEYFVLAIGGDVNQTT
ncbi:MAG TPA: cupin domain-containing protein [Candidatus Aquilonibacter sp.]|nr:cupin domain-containing protein [Candidatus Aquilonibacter sp.]